MVGTRGPRGGARGFACDVGEPRGTGLCGVLFCFFYEGPAVQGKPPLGHNGLREIPSRLLHSDTWLFEARVGSSAAPCGTVPGTDLVSAVHLK